jgi:hypothetical protein
MKEMGAFKKHGMGIHSHVVEERINCNCKGPPHTHFLKCPASSGGKNMVDYTCPPI